MASPTYIMASLGNCCHRQVTDGVSQLHISLNLKEQIISPHPTACAVTFLSVGRLSICGFFNQ